MAPHPNRAIVPPICSLGSPVEGLVPVPRHTLVVWRQPALGAGGRVAEEVGSYGCCCSGPLQANLVLTLGAGGAAFAGLEEGSQGSLEDEGGEPECQELL